MKTSLVAFADQNNAAINSAAEKTIAPVPPVGLAPVTIDKKEKLAGVQYLRGIAASLVVLYHTTTMARLPKYFNHNILNGFFEPGSVGVELFFVISGFVIMYVSLTGHALMPKFRASQFMKRRIARIIPFMWVCIIGYALLRLLGRGNVYFPIKQYVRAFFLFPFGPVEPKQIWTLRFEFVFYLVFAILVMRRRPKWILLIAWFVLPCLWVLLSEKWTGINTTVVSAGDFFFSPFICLFGLGAFLGFLCLKENRKRKVPTKYGFPLCLLLTVPLFVLARLRETEAFADHYFINTIVIGVVSTLLLWFAIRLSSLTPNSHIEKLGLKLGDASYAIYLTHNAVISALLGLWSKLQREPNEAVLVAVILFCCCLAGVFIHEVVEKPLLKMLRGAGK